jgi:hypothetical protein
MKIHMKLWVLWLIQATPIRVASQSSRGSPNTKHIKNIGTSEKEVAGQKKGGKRNPTRIQQFNKELI